METDRLGWRGGSCFTDRQCMNPRWTLDETAVVFFFFLLFCGMSLFELSKFEDRRQRPSDRAVNCGHNSLVRMELDRPRQMNEILV